MPEAVDGDGDWGDWDPTDNPAVSHGYSSRAAYEADRARSPAVMAPEHPEV